MEKRKMIPFLRKTTQVLGLLLTTLGFFYQLPLASGLLIGISFLVGPIFCGWVCPFGALQDFVSQVAVHLGIKRRTMPTLLAKALQPLRYALLAIVLLISTDFIFELLSLDPRANLSNFLAGSSLTIIGWSLIILFMVISLFFERPFCNYLCIEGAKYGLFSATRVITVTRDKSSCISCNKCNKACPMNIDVAHASQVRSLQCINCLECVAQCPVPKTLAFKVLPIKKNYQRFIAAIFIAFSLSLSFLYVQATITGESMFSFAFDQDTEVATVSEDVAETAEDVVVDTAEDVMVDSAEDIVVDSEEVVDATIENESLTSDTTADIIDTTDAAGIPDGTYEGSGTGFRGETVVEVTVENEQITSIEIISTRDDQKWFSRAYSGVSSSILDEQNVDVDSVSGATYSSVAIMNAVKDALESAGGTNVSDISTELPTGGRRH